MYFMWNCLAMVIYLLLTLALIFVLNIPQWSDCFRTLEAGLLVRLFFELPEFLWCLDQTSYLFHHSLTYWESVTKMVIVIDILGIHLCLSSFLNGLRCHVVSVRCWGHKLFRACIVSSWAIVLRSTFVGVSLLKSLWSWMSMPEYCWWYNYLFL